MASILFVCTGNQFRSPIAAEAFRQQLIKEKHGANWKVGSAGTWTTPGLPAAPQAIELAREFGLDISNHRTSMISADLLREADLVLVMDSGHKESLQVEFPFAKNKIFLLSQVTEGRTIDIADPIRARQDARPIIQSVVGMIRNGGWKIFLRAGVHSWAQPFSK